MKNWSVLLSLCAFINSFEIVKSEWDKVVLEDQERLVRRKGKPRGQSMDLCLFQSQIHTRGFRSITHLFVSQDGKFILTAHRLEFADDPKLLHTTAQKKGSV